MMETLIVCDSGLGGLDVASRLFKREQDDGPAWNVVFFNAYPGRDDGYNKHDDAWQESMLQVTFEAMERFHPACCLLACNTLSIIWQRLSRRYRPSFPVRGIVETALGVMGDYMKGHPESDLLVLGTRTTVESQVYPTGLVSAGIDGGRIHSLGCPGLATLIEQSPLSVDVQEAIAEYARRAWALFSEKPRRLALAFCCTHFGYATRYWRSAFEAVFGNIDILNPNEHLTLAGHGASFRYLARMEMTPSQREAMTGYFKAQGFEQIAQSLLEFAADSRLF